MNKSYILILSLALTGCVSKNSIDSPVIINLYYNHLMIDVESEEIRTKEVTDWNTNHSRIINNLSIRSDRPPTKIHYVKYYYQDKNCPLFFITPKYLAKVAERDGFRPKKDLITFGLSKNKVQAFDYRDPILHRKKDQKDPDPIYYSPPRSEVCGKNESIQFYYDHLNDKKEDDEN